jgi:hypothetical protein
MSLTREDWVKLLVPAIVSAGILATLGQFIIRGWYSPDIRYGTGGAYMSPKLAVSSLGLKNWGNSDAENVTITASFADPVTEISTGQEATPFDISAGGIGQKLVTGTVKRLVPGEIVNIYFITEPSSPWVDQKPSIRVIKFNGGMGRTGAPVLTALVPTFLTIAIPLGVVWILAYYFGERSRHQYGNRVCQAIQLGVSAAQEGLTSEQLDAQVEKRRETMPFLNTPSKKLLMLYSHTAFEGAKQNPT